MIIDEVSDLVPIFVIASMVLGLLVWIIKAQINMAKQFEPNGGSSLRDSINRIESDMRDVRAKVDDHIEWHLGD